MILRSGFTFAGFTFAGLLIGLPIDLAALSSGVIAQEKTQLRVQEKTPEILLPAFDATRPAVMLPKTVTPDFDAGLKGPVDLAFGAYQRGLYVTAMREAMKRIEADSNDGPAMALVAELYRDGLSVKQSQEEANKWYKLAADRGDPQAQYSLGLSYLEGRGMARDLKQARVYFEKAAEKNQPVALYNLAIMAIDSEIQDFKSAADLFRRSMDGGYPDAAYALSMFYKEGTGVPKDPVMATSLLKRAADEKLTPAVVDYAIALFNGIGTEKNEELAAKYFIRAAWLNAPVAQNRLARLYVVGRGVKPDLVEAMKWHVLARANGVPDEWLDDKLRTLSQGQKAAVDEAIQRFLGK
jgi:TPR repeat protein